MGQFMVGDSATATGSALLLVAHQQRVGDLELQRGRRQPAAAQPSNTAQDSVPVSRSDDGSLITIGTTSPLSRSATALVERQAENRGRHLVHQTSAFDHRKEAVGRDPAALRMPPADERLEAAGCGVAQLHERC
jgi:hypothetical protein